MHIVVLGAAGMIGRKLAWRLATDGRLGETAIDRLTLYDVVPPSVPAGARDLVRSMTGDMSMPGQAELIVASRPDVIFHLAAIVSGEAEADFGRGYRVNLDGTRSLFEAVRRSGDGYAPRLVYTSSVAVFGSSMPEMRDYDEIVHSPVTSYGTQKAIIELLLADYARRGVLDGVGIRLPTICVRPGPPNQAASGFFSAIIREPLSGQEAVLPVPDGVRQWHASPRAAVDFLLHAARLDTARLGIRRSLTMPGLSVTVGEQIEALRRVAGDRAVSLIRRVPDEAVRRIVEGWPETFNADRALALGFRPDESFDAIVRTFIDEELGGRLPA